MWMIWVSLFFWGLSSSGPGWAGDLIALDRLSIDYRKLSPGKYDSLINGQGPSGREVDKGLGLDLDLRILGAGYMTNRVHGTVDRRISSEGNGQFRSIGWKYELGVHVFRTIDVFLDHHSQHLLDWRGTAPFPVEDGMGLRLNLFENQGKKEKVF